ncbi:hypothetical protein QMZ92_09360 [Streptomyces sp. HNM0645]|uniref:hypothetical protein n=1 Tax=Streptomyces sp. HNM0645 TaxID=2782343 RepID=UPI0024B7FB3B|nr:hypothetical protein [Streptomyces sp. HNM0645]MDI9884600.1 hypothetical protein [Streptomyces sp. HNM0645]
MATAANTTTTGTPDGETPGSVRVEITRLRNEATRQKALAHRRAEFWAKADVALGFPAALLAGTAGATGLATADARIPAALLALASAGFAAGASFLRSATRCRANKRARQAWAAVEGRATVKLAQGTPTPDDLGELLDLRQSALGAYNGEDPQPGQPSVTAG